MVNISILISRAPHMIRLEADDHLWYVSAKIHVFFCRDIMYLRPVFMQGCGDRDLI